MRGVGVTQFKSDNRRKVSLSRQLQARLNQVKSSDRLPLMLQFNRGIEKEGLRVTTQGQISQAPHPVKLGSALTHPYITTDFAESQLEFITPVSQDVDQSLDKLHQLHAYATENIASELIWPASMPCYLKGEEDVAIAEYGGSVKGKSKHIYRLGLANRYGRIMQSISGIHYNFSLPDEFWQSLYQEEKTTLSLQEFISEQYFGLMRNFNRYSWLLCYLFGASPVLDKSFMTEGSCSLAVMGKDSIGLPYATSLRMSGLGYQSQAQASLNISLNSLDAYLEDFDLALNQHYQKYEKYEFEKPNEEQLNSNILQIENEYYSQIRPKRNTLTDESANQALKARGVEYIEIRLLDLNPFLPLGIDKKQIDFIDTFLLYCLLAESSPITQTEQNEIADNHTRVLTRGREPGLNLLQSGKVRTLKESANQIFYALRPIAKLLDSAQEGATGAYGTALDAQLSKVRYPELTPSGEIIAKISGSQSVNDLMLSLSEGHKAFFKTNPISSLVNQSLAELAQQSHFSQHQMELQEWQSLLMENENT